MRYGDTAVHVYETPPGAPALRTPRWWARLAALGAALVLAAMVAYLLLGIYSQTIGSSIGGSP